mmetsp:Transcript_45801/g.114586  ORF Transcript_45801/g.114586 Transcript_45801/m.114586 type:complete len:704 (+) Transcript_45801:653-2764(+)
MTASPVGEADRRGVPSPRGQRGPLLDYREVLSRVDNMEAAVSSLCRHAGYLTRVKQQHRRGTSSSGHQRWLQRQLCALERGSGGDGAAAATTPRRSSSRRRPPSPPLVSSSGSEGDASQGETRVETSVSTVVTDLSFQQLASLTTGPASRGVTEDVGPLCAKNKWSRSDKPGEAITTGGVGVCSWAAVATEEVSPTGMGDEQPVSASQAKDERELRANSATPAVGEPTPRAHNIQPKGPLDDHSCQPPLDTAGDASQLLCWRCEAHLTEVERGELANRFMSHLQRAAMQAAVTRQQCLRQTHLSANALEVVEKVMGEIQELRAAKNSATAERDTAVAELRALKAEISTRYSDMNWPCTTPPRMAKQSMAGLARAGADDPAVGVPTAESDELGMLVAMDECRQAAEMEVQRLAGEARVARERSVDCKRTKADAEAALQRARARAQAETHFLASQLEAVQAKLSSTDARLHAAEEDRQGLQDKLMYMTMELAAAEKAVRDGLHEKAELLEGYQEALDERDAARKVCWQQQQGQHTEADRCWAPSSAANDTVEPSCAGAGAARTATDHYKQSFRVMVTDEIEQAQPDSSRCWYATASAIGVPGAHSVSNSTGYVPAQDTAYCAKVHSARTAAPSLSLPLAHEGEPWREGAPSPLLHVDVLPRTADQEAFHDFLDRMNKCYHPHPPLSDPVQSPPSDQRAGDNAAPL